MRKRNAPPGAMITDAPFALPAAGLYRVRVGVTTLRTMRLPPRLSVCSCHFQVSEPGAAPDQIAKTPAASELSGWPGCATEDATAAAMNRTVLVIAVSPAPG